MSIVELAFKLFFEILVGSSKTSCTIQTLLKFNAQIRTAVPPEKCADTRFGDGTDAGATTRALFTITNVKELVVIAIFSFKTAEIGAGRGTI